MSGRRCCSLGADYRAGSSRPLFACSTFQACNNMFWFEYDMQRTDETHRFCFSTAPQQTSTGDYTLASVSQQTRRGYTKRMIQVALVVPQSPAAKQSVRMSSCNGKASHSSVFPMSVSVFIQSLFHLHQRKKRRMRRMRRSGGSRDVVLFWFDEVQRGGSEVEELVPETQTETVLVRYRVKPEPAGLMIT